MHKKVLEKKKKEEEAQEVVGEDVKTISSSG